MCKLLWTVTKVISATALYTTSLVGILTIAAIASIAFTESKGV